MPNNNGNNNNGNGNPSNILNRPRPNPGSGNPNPALQNGNPRGQVFSKPSQTSPTVPNSLLLERERLGNRTGGGRYDTNNNRMPRGLKGNAQIVNNAPIDIVGGTLANKVFRSENISVHNRWRNGYYSYWCDWRDDYFYYPYYCYQPVSSGCFVSPWYYYIHLPGYLTPRRCVILNAPIVVWVGQPYNWTCPSTGPSYYQYSELDYAIDDLVRGWERGERRALNRLIDRNGNVDVFLDGRYAYSLDPEDYYDLMWDAINYTDTVEYRIFDVKTWRDEVEFKARHEFYDPWHQRQVVYHTYRLKEDRYGYRIVRFGTERSDAYRF